MSSQQRKKAGPLKGDHQIAGVRGKMKIIDVIQSNADAPDSNGSNGKEPILSKSNVKIVKSRKSPGISRKSPRSSPRTSPARTSNRTPSPHHSHKSHKDGKISPRAATRGLKPKPRGKFSQGPPAHDAKVNVGGGSRSAFADAKVGAANANTPSSIKGVNRGGPSPSSNEVSQILKSKRNSGNNNYVQRNSGSNSFGRGSSANSNSMMADVSTGEDTRAFELNAREKPSALIAAPKVNPNIDNMQGSSRMIMSKVSRRHGRTAGRPNYTSPSIHNSNSSNQNVYDRNEQFLNNPFPVDNNPILPWLSSSSTKVVSMSTQTGAGSNTGGRHPHEKGAQVDADYEAVRSEVQEKRRRASSWGPSSRRRKAKAAADAKVAASKKKVSTRNRKGEVEQGKSFSATLNGDSKKMAGRKSRTTSSTASSRSNQFVHKNSMNLALKEISIEEIDRLQFILAHVKEDMIRKEQQSTLITGQLKEALEQHNLDDVGTDFEVIVSSVEDDEGDDLEKARPRNCKSGPAALRRGQDMKEVIQAMNQIEGNPEKTLKQTFEEIEEEIRRKRMSGDGRTNGNAGPQAVYEAAQLRLRGLGSSTIGRSFTSTTVAESHGEMQSNDNFQRNHQEQLDEDLAESNVEDAGVGARLAPNLKMFKSRENSENFPTDQASPFFEAAGSGNLIVENLDEDTNNEIVAITKSPQKLTAQPPKVPGLNLRILKSPRSNAGHSNSNSPDLSKQMLDIASPRSAFSKTSARSTLTNSSTGSN
eukprot:g2936.t1